MSCRWLIGVLRAIRDRVNCCGCSANCCGCSCKLCRTYPLGTKSQTPISGAFACTASTCASVTRLTVRLTSEDLTLLPTGPRSLQESSPLAKPCPCEGRSLFSPAVRLAARIHRSCKKTIASSQPAPVTRTHGEMPILMGLPAPQCSQRSSRRGLTGRPHSRHWRSSLARRRRYRFTPSRTLAGAVNRTTLTAGKWLWNWDAVSNRRRRNTPVSSQEDEVCGPRPAEEKTYRQVLLRASIAQRSGLASSVLRSVPCP
jgi:hypothetical protein